MDEGAETKRAAADRTGVPAGGDAGADIPEADLTPAVRAVLYPLRAEAERLRAALDAAHRRIETLESLAYRDPLLGLFNRRAFMRELERAVAMADRHGVKASLVFIDVDDMKAINDAHGHRAGDAALQRVARILSDNVRQTDAAGRLGGDEFGLVLTHTDQPSAEAKAVRLAAMIAAAPAHTQAGPVAVRVSHGAAAIEPGVTVGSLMEAADSAMYARKRKKTG